MHPIAIEVDRLVANRSKQEMELLLAEIAKRFIIQFGHPTTIALTDTENNRIATVLPESASKWTLTKEEFVARGLKRADDPSTNYISADELMAMIEKDCSAKPNH
jgi:hypothetical protein